MLRRYHSGLLKVKQDPRFKEENCPIRNQGGFSTFTELEPGGVAPPPQRKRTHRLHLNLLDTVKVTLLRDESKQVLEMSSLVGHQEVAFLPTLNNYVLQP